MDIYKNQIAKSLLQIAKESKTEFLEESKIDKKIKDAAKKLGLELPNPDISVFRTVWAKIDSKNLNGVRIPRKVVEEGLKTILFKQVNWEHEGSGHVCGVTIDAEIDGDKIITTNIFYKSLFADKFEELKGKIKSGEAAVSFEIWNRDPETKKPLIKVLEDGTKEFIKMIVHGTGLLLINSPAEPTARIFSLIAQKELKNAEQIVNKVFAEDLIYASFALEKSKEVKIVIKQIDSKIWICPHCEKEIGEKELFYDEKNQKWYHSPCKEKGEIILPKDNNKEETKLELIKLFENVKAEVDINFDLAMAFYYASEEEQNGLTEDAAKWTRKFINSLPDSAFAVIEPAYPEKLENKNCRHLPHHNGEGDLGKDKSNANLDLAHYKNALARVNQIKPVSDSISAEDLQKKASSHLERHRDALEKSSEETKTEEKPTETKTEVVAETKVEETKVEETKEVAQPLETIEPKIITKVTRIYSDVYVDTYTDGTMSGTSVGKSKFKKITEYKDGTKDEVEEESEFKKKFDFAELEEAVNKAKEELVTLHATELEAKTNEVKVDLEKKITEKETELSNLKKELDAKAQEIAELIKPKVEEAEKQTDVEIGNPEVKEQGKYKKIRKEINTKAYGHESNGN